MRILALDLGKFKSVACDYEVETGRHQFATMATNPKALHDLMVDREPAIEQISITTRSLNENLKSLGRERRDKAI